MTSSFPAGATRRLILVPSGPSSARGRSRASATTGARSGDEMVRRYRLARLRLEGRPVGKEERFEHVRRSYD